MKIILSLSFILLGAFASANVAPGKEHIMIVGGTTDEKKPDEDSQKVVDSLTKEIKTSAMANLVKSGVNVDNAEFDKAPIEVLSYKTQVVAGKNFFVKIRITTFIFHVRIYQHFSGSTQLSKLIGPKKESDPLVYFDG